MTVAVKSTEVPKAEGLAELVRVVVVAACEVIVRHQPFAMDPESPEASSRTYRLHCPSAPAPLNVDSAVAALGVGAGAGKVSEDPSSTLVGL